MILRRLPAALLALVLVVPLTGVAHAAGHEVIQPGVPIASGTGGCTLSWIFDEVGGAGRVFAATARHCVADVGAEVLLTDTQLGDPVAPIGSVAVMGGEGLDYALVEVDAANRERVDPSLRGHPAIPVGVSRSPSLGDLVQFSGHGVGFHLLPLTQQSRVGVLAYDDGCHHFAYGAVTPGDSGGPVANLSDGGTALGIVSTLGVSVGLPDYLAVGEGGVSLPCVLADSAAQGVPITLRTVGQ